MAEMSHADVLSFFVVLSAVSADIVWVMAYPEMGVPCMLMALAAQVCVLLVKRGAKDSKDRIEPYDWALTCWIFGSSMWMFSEYMWDSDLDVAAFADRVTGKEFHDLDVAFKADVLQNRQLYPKIMGVSCFTLWTTLLSLVGFMMVEHAARRWWADEAKVEASSSAAGRDCDEDIVCGMPMHIYEELWFMPWLFMESCWVLNDTQMVMHLKMRPCFWFGVTGGILAMLMCGDCVRRYMDRKQHREAVLCAAHLAWVGGNLVWYVLDVEEMGDLGLLLELAPVSLFVTALLCLLLSTQLTDCPEPVAVKVLPCKAPAKASLSETASLLADCDA